VSEKILVIDPVSTKNLVVFYEKSKKIIFQNKINLFESKPRKNLANLVNKIKHLFVEKNQELLDLNKIIFCSGPGSFSILRNICVFIKTLKVFKPEIKVFRLNLAEVAFLYLEKTFDSRQFEELKNLLETSSLNQEQKKIKSISSIALKSKFGFFRVEPESINSGNLKLELTERVENSKILVFKQKFYDYFSLSNFLIELELKNQINSFLVEKAENILPEYGKEPV